MAGESRRQLWLLAVLTVALVGVLWWRLSPEPPPTSPAAVARVPVAPAARRAPGSPVAVEPVRLDVLAQAGVKPTEGRRDPFTFAAVAPPPSPSGVKGPGGGKVAGGSVVGGPGGGSPTGMTSGPPAPPPMGLKFIGILKPTSASPIAVLTDGKNVFYGREGETVDGRYRIERIGVESIEMAWADGRGRQVIRLSGS